MQDKNVNNADVEKLYITAGIWQESGLFALWEKDGELQEQEGYRKSYFLFVFLKD